MCIRDSYTGDVDAAHDVLHDGFIKIFTPFTFRGECALSLSLIHISIGGVATYMERADKANVNLFI